MVSFFFIRGWLKVWKIEILMRNSVLVLLCHTYKGLLASRKAMASSYSANIPGVLFSGQCKLDTSRPTWRLNFPLFLLDDQGSFSNNARVMKKKDPCKQIRLSKRKVLCLNDITVARLTKHEIYYLSASSFKLGESKKMYGLEMFHEIK